LAHFQKGSEDMKNGKTRFFAGAGAALSREGVLSQRALKRRDFSDFVNSRRAGRLAGLAEEK
jgi:hypothetical protein